ncbi:Glyoxylate reductase [Tolypocladium ophioglossoides CBS 100239]|uniref:Glyoxylate reductase n=1 Tax=Tolypocladium ophioglossoides (strain CBS 100239) TaxID=1163406 RepID=A0A0L0MY53_TOLOC|nr:Glyoxylate reductase [Tolypocladium ophioglossoides CBS 100239]
MIISTFRQLPWCVAAAASGSAAAFRDCHLNAPAQSHNLRGQALGIVGMGNIGQRVASRCRHGFGMQIHYFDSERKSRSAELAVAATFHDTLPGLLRAADCVVLCAPASTGPGPGAAMDASALAHLRPGARLVNVGRGALVDEDALVAAMQQQRVSAVALDVHADEPRPHEGLRRLAAQGRALLTCHNAGGTVETHAAFEELSMRNVMAVLSGGRALTAVNLGQLKT